MTLSRLPTDPERQPVHNGLDLRWGARVLLRVVEDDRQYKWTRMLLDRHPLISKHHPVATVHPDNMMVIAHQLLCLYA